MKNTLNTKEEKVYTAGEVGSMLESIDSTLKIVSENYLGLNGRMDSIDKRFDAMDSRFDAMDSRFDMVEKKIDRLQDDMVEVKYELKNKVNRDEFERLEKRVIKLEKVSLSR